MLLDRIDIVFIEPCLVVPNKVRVKAELSCDIREVMPYLNTVIKNATYNRHAENLTFTRDFRLITLYPGRVTMAKAVNATDAYQVLDWLKDLINETWDGREKIVPSYEMKSRPKPLEIYGWLPKTNCRDCGEMTCLAFATKLLLGEQQIKNCLPLFREEYRDLKEPMLEIAAALGYEIS